MTYAADDVVQSMCENASLVIGLHPSRCSAPRLPQGMTDLVADLRAVARTLEVSVAPTPLGLRDAIACLREWAGDARRTRNGGQVSDAFYDAELERQQEDWMAAKRGEHRCTRCDGDGNGGYCPACHGTGFARTYLPDSVNAFAQCPFCPHPIMLHDGDGYTEHFACCSDGCDCAWEYDVDNATPRMLAAHETETPFARNPHTGELLGLAAHEETP